MTTVRLGLGLDTGGTYTDAVILNLENGDVLQRAKALTTKEDLVIGIKNAILDFDKDLMGRISLVSMSTTLATNSVVEGKGSRIGLICIGRDFDGSIKIDQYLRVSGRHDIDGNEVEPLDEEAIIRFVEETKDRLDCYAVTGYMSVRNPGHEILARGIITDLSDKPVVCGHQLSSILGYNERTVTAVMNAGLIPVIEDLIRSVKEVMKDEGMDAPIMIVKGDGSIMNVKVAKERPVETILSGPAASLTGAMALTGLADAIVVDMGGTTTDIGVLRDGYPDIDEKGAMIGGRKTHVMAAEISTSGIGGDSRILLNGRSISLKPARVIPLCLAVSRWPELLEDLKNASESTPIRHEAINEDNVISDIEFFTASKIPKEGTLSPLDTRLISLLKERPLTLRVAGVILDAHPTVFNVRKMEENNMINRIGLTPTDILHSEGSYLEYDPRASEYGVTYMANKAGMSNGDLISKVKDMVSERISLEILTKVIYDETGSTDRNLISENLIYKSITGSNGRDFTCRIALNKPIIGIGAPVNAWLPEVSRRLNTDYISAKNSHVGNAIGAISGCIIESVDVLIEPEKMGLSKSSVCTAYSKLGKEVFETLEDGIEYAKREGARYTEEAARRAGAASVGISYDIKEKTFELQGSTTIISVTVSVVATGKPAQMA